MAWQAAKRIPVSGGALATILLLAGSFPVCGSIGTRHGAFSLAQAPGISRGVVPGPRGGWVLEAGREKGTIYLVLRDLPERLHSLTLSPVSSPGWSFFLARRGQAWTEVSPEAALIDPILWQGDGPLVLRAVATREASRPSPELGAVEVLASWSNRELPSDPEIGGIDDPVTQRDRQPLPDVVEIPEPVVLSKEEWGGLPPKEPYDPQNPYAIVIHHSWLPTAGNYYRTGGAESVAGIQRFHMFDKDRMWNDTGYHYLIGPDGNIFAARPPNAVGAHAPPNTGKLGICMLGNYDPEGDPVTPEAWASLEELVSYLVQRFDITMDELYGHRDFSHKTCPGDMVFHRFPALRREVFRRLGSMGVDRDIAW